MKRLVVAMVLLLACRGREPAAGLERDAAILTARTLGLAYLRSQQFAQAETAFAKIVALAPDQALGYANLGLVHLRLGRYDVAEREIRRAARPTRRPRTWRRSSGSSPSCRVKPRGSSGRPSRWHAAATPPPQPFPPRRSIVSWKPPCPTRRASTSCGARVAHRLSIRSSRSTLSSHRRHRMRAPSPRRSASAT